MALEMWKSSLYKAKEEIIADQIITEDLWLSLRLNYNPRIDRPPLQIFQAGFRF